MTQKVFPAAVRVRHGGTPAPQVHFSHKYNGHYWQKTFPPPPYDIIISLLWKKSTIRIDKIITKFFCNFHRKFALCLLPVTIPKTQKSLFSSKYGTFWLPWFSLTRYFVSLNEIIQIPSYALPFGITDVCSQIFQGYARMQRVFRMVQLLFPSGVFRCVLLFSKAGSMITIWNICIELYGLLSQYGNSCKGNTDSHGRSADWSWEWQCYIYVDSLQQPMMLFAFIVSCG